MGHERIGRLPRTLRWVRVVEAISQASEEPKAVAELADMTLSNVRDRFDDIERDRGVAAAMEYLIALSQEVPSAEGEGPEIPDLTSDPSAARLAWGLCKWVDANRGLPEYAELAKQAGSDTIASWSRPDSQQQDLFPGQVSLQERWLQASTGAGFSEVARQFFSHFTERYLRYFLDREASATLNSIAARNRLSAGLGSHIDAVAIHAFETSKITQSFAAGWFNRYAREGPPSQRQLRGFLRLAFQKIREELAREAILK